MMAHWLIKFVVAVVPQSPPWRARQGRGREMEGVGSKRGRRGVLASASMCSPDAWRPRGIEFLPSVGHGQVQVSELWKH
jgi:hypothetical protein